MRNLARWCFTHRFIVLAIWIVALVAAVGVKGAVGSKTADNFKLPNTESADAINLLQRIAPKESGDTAQLVIAVRPPAHVTDPAVRGRVEALLAQVGAFPHVVAADIASPYGPRGATQIAPGGRVAFATVPFDVFQNKLGDTQAQRFVSVVTGASRDGVEFELGGQIARAGRARSSSTGLPIGFLTAAVVLFLVFGTFAAMALPLLTAGLSIGVGIQVVGILSNVIDMADFANQLALLIGLGVGVDYALFIVTRYRQSSLRGNAPADAIVEALDTSGRAVLFAGIIVCIAMLGMFALGVSFLYGVAIAAAVTVAFTVLAAMTLLPALIALFGRFILRRRDRRALAAAVGGGVTTSDESPAWTRWTAVMSRRPAVFAAAGALVMIVIAIPFFSMRLGSADAGSDPQSATTRKAYDLLAQGFGPGYNGPLQLVAEVGSRVQAARFAQSVHAVEATPGVVGGTAPRFIRTPDGRAAVGLAEVYPAGSPQDSSTSALVDRLRGRVLPAATAGTGLRVRVAGETAIYDDFARVLTGKLPLFITVVVALSFLLLMGVFRSIVIPATAAAMNLLSTGAALGVVTAVFQNGWGASLLGIDQTGPIEAFLPVIMFPILFGLSMDYEVFLVSRIYEEWHRRGDNREAVGHGLAATGRTINAAAAIMVLVFAAFILGGERIIELFGVGLATAVLLDAVIVRSVIVPAVMLLLGAANWHLPAFLDRFVPRLNIEGRAPAAVPAAPREPERVPA